MHDPFESYPDQYFESFLFLQAIKKKDQQQEEKTDDDETVEDIPDGEFIFYVIMIYLADE